MGDLGSRNCALNARCRQTWGRLTPPPSSRVVEGCHVLLHSSACGLSIALLDPLRAWDRPLLVGVRRDQARINRKLLTTDQPRRNTCLNDTLKDPAKNVVVTEPLIAGSREHRMVRNLVFDAQAAKPAERQIDPDLASEQSF